METTGTDITKDRVVEKAAIHAHNDSRMRCESFATTIQVDADIIMERGQEAFKVHGITNEEIQQSPSFEEAWHRFVKWIIDVMNLIQMTTIPNYPHY